MRFPQCESAKNHWHQHQPLTLPGNKNTATLYFLIPQGHQQILCPLAAITTARAHISVNNPFQLRQNRFYPQKL
jgi:hypothetical protein